jgi:hypothetical protein
MSGAASLRSVLRLNLGCLSIVVLLRACTARRCAIGAELKIGSDLSSGVASQAEVADLLICFAIVNLRLTRTAPLCGVPRRYPTGRWGPRRPWPERDGQVRRGARCVRSKRCCRVSALGRQEGIRSHQHREKRFDPYPTVFIPPCQKPVRRRAPTAHAAHALERPDSAARARAEPA